MAKRFTLGKDERLKSRKQTELLFREGKRFNLQPFRVHYHIDRSESATLLFGVGVSARTFSKAVDRNRIKRLVREAYRLQKNELQEQLKQHSMGLDVFFIYTGKEMPVYSEIYDKTGKALNQLCRTIGDVH